MTHNDADAGSRGRGQAIREARVRRVRRIRRRVVSGAVALFIAAWLLIAIVLVSGHDPALGRKTSTVAAGSGTGTTTSASGAGATSGVGTTSGAGATSSVTTRQS